MLGHLFGSLVEKGQVVLLNGEMAAGKTCFAQGVGLGLGVDPSSPVTSPTYTLLNIHQGRMPLYHFDLYRLYQVDDLADLGYDEYAEGKGLTLVEWADRSTEPLNGTLEIEIKTVSQALRRFRFVATSPSGEILLDQLSEKWPEIQIPA